MKSRRFPLVSVPPLRRGFSRRRYDHQAIPQHAAWLRSRRARFRFARQDHCSSTTSIRLNFRFARYSGTIARNVHESDLRTVAVSCAKDYSYLNAAMGSTRMARDLLKPLILLTNLSEAARITSAVTGGSPCAFQSARRACMTSMRAARAAGSHDATTAAVSSTNAERSTGKAPGIFTSGK